MEPVSPVTLSVVSLAAEGGMRVSGPWVRAAAVLVASGHTTRLSPANKVPLLLLVPPTKVLSAYAVRGVLWLTRVGRVLVVLAELLV